MGLGDTDDRRCLRAELALRALGHRFCPSYRSLDLLLYSPLRLRLLTQACGMNWAELQSVHF